MGAHSDPSLIAMEAKPVPNLIATVSVMCSFIMVLMPYPLLLGPLTGFVRLHTHALAVPYTVLNQHQ